MDETKCGGPTHHEGCPCHEAGWRRRMAGALEEAQTERDTAAERRIERDDARAERDRYQQVAMDRTRERNESKAEADQLRARVQQLREELARWGHLGDISRALKDTAAERDRYRVQEAQQRVERIKAEGEARRLRAALVPFAGLLAAYLDEPTGLDAIPTHVRLDDVREARRALGLD